ncbi:glycerophosphoryl diester phosphodiesterase [Nocardia tenerifensis]|uniref:Glycerophosphoryl diester phosphodiesterase n=1 Tax=Nocardia tenerifensis TaxID=228006 RepID=A0A318KB56_9NOCA|nr:glycerophosphodiester phosphodiesterase family protein [Nocardia tenerifensis]PXX68982.1 glycerophosphoryl diester phosphodiesterase [Nocardia tenerifensis]
MSNLRAVLTAAVAGSLVVGAAAACDSRSDSAPATAPRTVELQAHRGGRGLTAEESLPAFAKAIESGVSTLELDIVLSKDKTPMIWHDPTVLATKCADTAPATPADPQFPYVGKLVHDLTHAQLQTLDCGKALAEFPGQQAVPGNRIATLPELFDLVQSYRDARLRYNIETKLEAEHPEQSATPQEFVDVILGAAAAAGETGDIDIQSFDWRSLPLVRKADPAIPIVALYDDTTFVAGSKWLGPLRYEDFAGDPLRAVQALGANAASPGYSAPTGRKVGEPGFALVADKAYVDHAHELGLRVIPWTVNDKATIAAQIDTGVDGVITDYPDRMREVLREKGLPLPPGYRR